MKHKTNASSPPVCIEMQSGTFFVASIGFAGTEMHVSPGFGSYAGRGKGNLDPWNAELYFCIYKHAYHSVLAAI